MNTRSNAAFVALVLVIMLSACARDERTALRVSTWSSPLEKAMVDRCVALFEERNPEVRVVHETYTSGYIDKILTAMAAGNPPDVILLDSIHIPTFTTGDQLVDLTPYLRRAGFRPELYYPNVLDIARVGEALYAFPKDFTPMVYFYNKDLFDRTGTPYPAFDWTFEDFRRTCVSLTGDDDGDGRADRFGTEMNRELYRWQPWLWSAGGDLVDPHGKRAGGYFDSPASIRAFTFLSELVTRDRVTRRYEALESMSRDYDQGQKMFYSGRIGLFPSGHWWLPQILRYGRKGGLNIGIVPYPRLNETSAPVTVMYESGFAVTRATRHRKWAVRLAAFLASEECQRILCSSGLAISAMPKVAEEIARADISGLERDFLRIVPTCRPPWGTVIPRWSAVEDVAPTVFDRILLKGESPAEAARAVAEQLDGVLANAWK